MRLLRKELLSGYIHNGAYQMVNNEKEVLRTTDTEKKNRFVKRLVNSGISYLEKWEKIPFFSRKKYDGAKEICVIMINEHQMEKAMNILYEVNNESMDTGAGKNKIKALMDGEKSKTGAEEEDFFDEEDRPQ